MPTTPHTAHAELPDAPCSEADAACLRATFSAARAAARLGNMPFGAALVKDGQLLWMAQNNQVTSGDCTGHAEVVLVREARQALGAQATVGATVYASGEPCAMCAGAMFWAGITRVEFGATTPDIEDALGDAGGPGGSSGQAAPSLPPRCDEVLAAARPAVEVLGPCLRDEAVAALRGEAPQG